MPELRELVLVAAQVRFSNAIGFRFKVRYVGIRGQVLRISELLQSCFTVRLGYLYARDILLGVPHHIIETMYFGTSDVFC